MDDIELTVSYRGRDFTVRTALHEPGEDEPGWLNEIFELGDEVSQPGYAYRASAAWPSDEIAHPTRAAAVAAAVEQIVDTVDDHRGAEDGGDGR